MEHLSPATIATELTQGFDLLETELRDLPEHQRSMQAVLDYSWQRLTSDEQNVFMRLAIFQGGFTRAAAQKVGGASLPILAHLVDKSFLQARGAERCEIHELLRQYAAQQLTTFRQIEADLENIRAAWQWAVIRDEYGPIDRALEGLFRWFWLSRSRQQEGLVLLHMALQRWSPEGSTGERSVWGWLVMRMIEQQGPWLYSAAAHSNTFTRVQNVTLWRSLI